MLHYSRTLLHWRRTQPLLQLRALQPRAHLNHLHRSKVPIAPTARANTPRPPSRRSWLSFFLPERGAAFRLHQLQDLFARNHTATVCPSGVLLAGDRVEIHFDLAHTGTISGFTFEVDWAATTILNRTGATGDSLVSGRAEAAILASGSQLSAQSWGTVLAFSAGVAPSTDAYAGGIAINFQGMLAQTGDTLTLANYTVIRVP